MFKLSPHNNFLWHYKVSIFFILTYWVLDPILYLHFGSAYISRSPNENNLLVFLAGSFRFSEDFQVNTPILNALLDALKSGNFWVPFLTIFIVEWRLPYGFGASQWQTSIGKSYLLGVVASYITGGIAWAFIAPYSPPPGTSIIAVCLVVTYWVGYYALKAFKSPRKQGAFTDVKISEYNIIALCGILFVTWFYVAGNGAILFHSMGFIFYLLLSYFLLKTPQ